MKHIVIRLPYIFTLYAVFWFGDVIQLTQAINDGLWWTLPTLLLIIIIAVISIWGCIAPRLVAKGLKGNL